MFQKILHVILSVILFVLALACDPQPDDPQPDDPRNAFLGTYSMLAVTDSLGVDGSWMSNAFAATVGRDEKPLPGMLTIAKGEAEDLLDIRGCVFMGENNADTVPYYTTQGILNADGTVTLNASTYRDANYTYQFTYGPMTLTDSLRFKAEMHVNVMGMDCGYIMTNYCAKQ